MSLDPERAPTVGPQRPARDDEIEPDEDMRAADRANGEPDAADADGGTAGFEQPETGTTAHQPLPVGDPRPPDVSKETP